MKNYYTRLLALIALTLFFSIKIAAQMVISSQVTPSSCFACNGSIVLSVTGGIPPYTFNWSTGATTQAINNLCPGSYDVWVSDASGVTQSGLPITVYEFSSTLSLVTCVTNVSCLGGFNGAIDLTVTGGTPGYTSLWSNGATTQDMSGLSAGTYTTTVADANGCTQTASATVNQPTAINISANVTNASAGNPNGALDLTVTGGTAPYIAQWSNGTNIFDLAGLTPGTYCVTVSDANACTRSSCFTVQDNGGGSNDPLLLNGQVTNAGCGFNCNGSLTITISNGIGPYFYSIENAPIGPIVNGTSSSNQFIIPNLCAGSCYVNVSDANGFSTSATYNIGQNQSQSLDIQSTNSAFCNFDPGNPASACEKVCPHTTVTYFVDPPVVCGVPMNLSNASWTVTGAESFSINGNEVVVTWGEARPGLVEFGASTPTLCFQSSHCVTVLEEPKAQFSTDPPSAPNVVMQVCKGQSVSFKNESLNAELYEWQFSDDLSILNTESPQHTFLIPGNFAVTLIARNNCLCADTTVLLIEVLDTEPPLLDCVGSVCPGETVTYSTSGNCSTYSWLVSPNGSVLSGGQASDNTITVQWADGPVGSISLSATGCAGAACPQASVFNIPIISDNAEIRGKEFVCPDSEEEYSIELFDGTEYVWTLTTGGSILRGQGTNKVIVAWEGSAPIPAPTKWLIVEYYNCYLGCGGADSIPVKIIPPFYIDGPVEMCENSSKNFIARDVWHNFVVNCNWSVFGPNGTLVSTFTGNTLNFTPNAGPGNYRLFAIPINPGQTCSPNAELKVNVAAKPPNPVAISGPGIVCPGSPLQYEVPGNPPYEIEWKTGNGTPATQTGNPVNVTWNTNPTHWISAAQISLDGLGCKSDTIKLNIQNAATISTSGPPSVCEGALGFYQADFYQGFDYQWEILPSTAGSIKQGQGKNSVEIFWQTPGSHQLRVTTCGLTTNFNVSVWANPEPMPIFPTGLCPGDSGLITAGASYITYAWENANGTPLGTGPNINIPTGAYTLSVTDLHGCRGTSEFSIDPLPAPNVSVTTADPAGFCNNSIFVSITALVPDDANFDYQWLHDGSPVGGNSVVYSTNQYGFYTVVATNEYGCTATAPPIQLFSYCIGGGGGGYCTGGGDPLCPPGTVQGVPDFTSRCDSFAMVLNDYSGGLYVPGSAVWRTGVSGTGNWQTSFGDNVNFVYPNAGKYIVLVRVLLTTGEVCEAVDSLDVEAAAQFSQKMACPGDSTLFTDESTRLPEMTIANWEWDFGEAGNSDISNLDSPGFAYSSAGNYTATLTITTATGCTSSYSENVFVPNLPAPAFAPPLANCAGNAAEFVLSSNTGIINAVWEFGDPASGTLNQSEANPAYHNYSPAGNYPVTVTATNSYGCTASITQSVNITANPFSGIIFPPTSTICQGSSLTLSAPLGPGAMYVWNDGTNLPTLIATEEGVYEVTLTNANGCSYSPPAKTVDVNPAPIGTIKFLEVNDLGQVVGVQYPEAAVCAGDDVTLQIQDNGNYTFSWSGGNGSDGVLIFSEDRNNLLSVGTHTFTVTVTNPATGCTAVLAPFTVTVNPVPSNFSLSANNVCAGTPSIITYTGPQPPEWQIFWNTGDGGPSLQTEEAGLYFVRVVNEFGCSAQSNTVVIFPGPNISALPSGCHERCNPDTLCLPPLPEIVSWQWFFGGQSIPGATSNQFVATQSGTYWAELVDLNGCEAQSAPLTVELYNGFGNILGQVWSDVNDNGIIDAADTLVSGIPVQLLQNGTFIAPNQSNQNGDFDWLNVISTNYTVQIDSQLLSSLWEIVIFSDSVGLTGCGGKVFAHLLVDSYTCPPISASVALTACPGQTALFNGTPVLAGQTQGFIFQNFLGCDSIVTVTVSALPISSSTLGVSACPGSFYNYNGVDLAVGQSQDFNLTNWLGCDSVVTVTVSALPISSSTLNASVCPGSFYNYAGVDLAVGQSQDFNLSNWLGCDSVVTVTVSALPISSSTLGVSACPGSFYNYNGVDLAVGQSQDFNLTNWLGCDSVVTVTVSALPISSSTLNASVCPGSFYNYAGVDLAVGQSQDFNLSNWLGCDSIVTVSVSALPISSSTLNASVCPGSFYNYAGVDLGVGQSQDFTLTHSVTGCDSIVTVTVSALPTSAGSASFGVCPNETYIYQGVALAAGSVQDFVLKNWLGCDSIMTVTIFEKQTSSEIREVNVCPGEVYVFQNQAIAAGEFREFHWTNGEGCDSSITISVTAWPGLDFEVAAETSCPNSPTGSLVVTVNSGGSVPTGFSLDNVDFQTAALFESLAAGSHTVFVRDDNGCIFEKSTSIPASPGLEVLLPSALVIPCDSVQITLAPIIGGDTSGLQLLWWNGAQTPSV
ncbi:MAG: PKD domain-containing protein, partial [Saprospiraceae bacterium]|nr:PKD domain-containing protein [Saprospiraceae bacterium]